MKEHKVQIERKDWEDRLKRALADYANLQKRTEEEKSKIAGFAKGSVLNKFLRVLDNLEQLEKIITKEGSDSLRQGFDLALRDFRKILSEEGVEEIETSGNFDPQIHEAVEVVKDKQDNKVKEMVEKGYKLGDVILRPARVVVTKKSVEHRIGVDHD